MDKKLKSAIKQSFTPPKTQHKESFINSISYPQTTFREVLFSQITFIRKRVWLLFMLTVGFALIYTQLMEIPENIVSGISAILPVLSLCTITELYKSVAYNMEEMELACKYNLPKILLMRIAILGAITFVTLALLVILVTKNDFGVLRNVFYISVPYLLSSALSIFTITNFRSKEATYVCGAISGAVSIFIAIASSSYEAIYNAKFTLTWGVLFVVFTGILFYSITRFTRLQEELKWNLA